MAIQLSSPIPTPQPHPTTTKNLFEVAVLLSFGLHLDEAQRQGGKVVFGFSDARAQKILAAHRNGEIQINSRDFVNAINAARDIAFAM